MRARPGIDGLKTELKDLGADEVFTEEEVRFPLGKVWHWPSKGFPDDDSSICMWILAFLLRNLVF